MDDFDSLLAEAARTQAEHIADTSDRDKRRIASEADMRLWDWYEQHGTPPDERRRLWQDALAKARAMEGRS